MNDLVIKNAELSEQYKGMIGVITESLPEIKRVISHHIKGRSQFQANVLDIGLTKLRNMRALTVKINETLSGLEELSFNAAELEINARLAEKEAQRQGGFALELSQLKAQQLRAKHARALVSIEGAIRKIAGLVEQFSALEKAAKLELGLGENDVITELHFEQDEERYNIMKAFEQALHAFRTIGRIDEGNNIYLFQIGINGELARRDIQEYLEQESVFIEKLDNPHSLFSLEFSFLERMAEKYKGCSENLSKIRGVLTMASSALLEE